MLEEPVVAAQCAALEKGKESAIDISVLICLQIIQYLFEGTRTCHSKFTSIDETKNAILAGTTKRIKTICLLEYICGCLELFDFQLFYICF
jgi:hypothetical protein